MPKSPSVFVLQHVHVINDGDEDVKLIGVYSTRERAEQAVARLQSQQGFSDTPEGFSIDEYVIDQDHWTDGYVTDTRTAIDHCTRGSDYKTLLMQFQGGLKRTLTDPT